MDTAVVVGNCQAKALEMVMSCNEHFSGRFRFAEFPAVHEIAVEMVPVLHDAVSRAKLVVAQRVDEGYRDGIGLGTETIAALAGDAVVIRWPSVYWAGYVPDLFYLRDLDGLPVVDGPFDYHDRTILQAYADGSSVSTACERLADPESPSDAVHLAGQATAELAIRGEGCDIDIAGFIDANYRERLLFHTMNHPTNFMLGYLAEQIIGALDLPKRVYLSALPGEVLGSTFYPLHVNHVRALHLEFGESVQAGVVPFRVRGSVMDQSDAVREFFRYYDTNPGLVRHNLLA